MFGMFRKGLSNAALRIKAIKVIAREFNIPSDTQDCLNFIETCSVTFGKNYNEYEIALAYVTNLVKRFSEKIDIKDLQFIININREVKHHVKVAEKMVELSLVRAEQQHYATELKQYALKVAEAAELRR